MNFDSILKDAGMALAWTGDQAAKFGHGVGNGLMFGKGDNIYARVDTSVLHDGKSFEQNLRLEHQKTLHGGVAGFLGETTGEVGLGLGVTGLFLGTPFGYFMGGTYFGASFVANGMKHHELENPAMTRARPARSL